MNIRRRATRALGSLLLVAVAIAGVVGVMARLMSHDGNDTPRSAASPSTIDPKFLNARDGLCAAAARARGGDPSGARTLFFERAHQPLHELAAAAQEEDPAVAARLLEAKAQVEASLEPPHDRLADNLDVLAQAVGRAMWSAGGNDPGPCLPPQ